MPAELQLCFWHNDRFFCQNVVRQKTYFHYPRGCLQLRASPCEITEKKPGGLQIQFMLSQIKVIYIINTLDRFPPHLERYS